MIETLIIYQFSPEESEYPFQEEEEPSTDEYWDDLRYRLSLIDELNAQESSK